MSHILESHILFNHPHGDYIISVAVETSPGYWKGYYKQVKEISISSLQDVSSTGKSFSEKRALSIFEACRADQELGRRKYQLS